MKSVPPISRFMFQSPITMDRDASVQEAKETLDRYGFRHLPIVHQEKVVGVVSNRDIDLANVMEQRLGALKIHMIMSTHVFSVEAGAPLDDVLSEMARYKYGCTVVIDKGGKPIGIFTAIDAMNVLCSLLHEEESTIELSKCIWPRP